MLTVSHDPAVVESQLLSGELSCPRCGGVLTPWSYGSRRIIRYGTPAENQRVTPRRARCRDCATTQILLPVQLAARRADETSVIAQAVELNVASGWGHRKIAEKLGRPLSTVRDWIRDFRANAPAIATDFATRVHRATATALGFWPAPGPTVAADALAMLIAHAQVLAHHHQPASSKTSDVSTVVIVTWHQAALLAMGPSLFSRVGWPKAVQHQPALPPDG